MAHFSPSLGSIFDFGEEGVCVGGGGGGGAPPRSASRLVLERETHNLGQNRQKPLKTPYLKIKDIAPSPEGDKLKEADSLVFHFILSKIMEL